MSPRPLACCLCLLCVLAAGLPVAASADAFAELEQRHQARIGLAAIDVRTGRSVLWRAEERFAFCSTFKVLLAACVLQRSLTERHLLHERLHWRASDEQEWSPVTAGQGGRGMTVAELCAAAVGVSDNTAANVLLTRLGGPQAVTAYARSLGDEVFRLDRMEPDLNAAAPGDVRDTTTPLAFARTLHGLLCGTALPAAQRRQLADWLSASATGEGRIRAALPPDWKLAHKTGSGGGLAHDAGLAEAPDGRRVILVVFTQSPDTADMARKEALIAEAARRALRALGVREKEGKGSAQGKKESRD